MRATHLYIDLAIRWIAICRCVRVAKSSKEKLLTCQLYDAHVCICPTNDQNTEPRNSSW